MAQPQALTILEREGDTAYDGYLEMVSRWHAEYAALPVEGWTSTLYWNWLHALRPLLETKGAGYPSFMQGEGWQLKSLNSWLGSWAELRHDTLLYAKQSYAAEATGAELEIELSKGYVEPEPEVFARLAALDRQLLDGLDARGLLNDELRAKLRDLEALLLALKTVSEKELRAEPLSAAEYRLIREIGDRLAELDHLFVLAGGRVGRRGG